MPQADLYYSAGLPLDALALLEEIETTITAHDPSSGLCKGRAHKVEHTHHRHILLRLALLQKPHRDGAFMTDLRGKLLTILRGHGSSPCALAVEVQFLSPHYATETM